MSLYQPLSDQTGSDCRAIETADFTSLSAAPRNSQADQPSTGFRTADTTPEISACASKTSKLRRGSSQIYRNIRILSLKAVELVEKMVEASTGEQPEYDVAIAGNELCETLSDLWKLREYRCKNWQSGLNFVQSALKNTTFEVMGTESCKHLLDAVKTLQSSELEREDTQMIKKSLKQAKIDPWNAISSRD